jgi:hypothetical protein
MSSGDKVVYLTAFCIAFLLAALPSAFASTIALTDVATVGSATVAGASIVRLMPNHDTTGEAAPAGAAWLSSRVRVEDPFRTSFDFHLWGFNGYTDQPGRPTGDGFAFVIQNDPAGTGALGTGAGGLGYMFLTNSIAIEFDAYQNAGYGDPNGNHVAVNTLGTGPNVPHHTCSGGHLDDPQLPQVPCASSPTLGMNTDLTFDLRDTAVHHSNIVYDGTALWVYVDGALQLKTPIDISGVLGLHGWTSARIGFTAGARYSYENADISHWSLNQVPEPPVFGLVTAGLGGLWTLRRIRKLRRGNDRPRSV